MGKEETKLLFAGEVILCTESPKEHTHVFVRTQRTRTRTRAAMLQDMKSVYKNKLCFSTLDMDNQKGMKKILFTIVRKVIK